MPAALPFALWSRLWCDPAFNGLLKKTWGSRTYPVEYTYDTVGRMTTLKTWQDYGAESGPATTAWNYQPQRGWLQSKRYPDPVTGLVGTRGGGQTIVLTSVRKA